MPIAIARIPTDRAGRYLGQLCGHLDQMSRMRHRMPAGHDGQQPPTVTSAECSDTAGTVRFAQGTWTLEATPDALTVRVDADDEDNLRWLQDGFTRRIAKIGRRDRLAVHWQDSAPRDAETVAPSPRRYVRALLLIAVAAVAIAVHIGLLGAALASSAWASWGTNVVLAIIVLKVLVAAVHVVSGRTAVRHDRKIFRRDSPAKTGDSARSPSHTPDRETEDHQ
jgi:hypothetical protein